VSQADAALRKIPNLEPTSSPAGDRGWPTKVYEILKAADVRQMAYVPDAGHTTLINLFCQDPDVDSNVLTTEEEGIAIAAGAYGEGG